ncbi:MAG: shikimate kinase AroK [Xanthomonadales bacterium]|nr:shikimate kinase AroK [Xanthomonadales bacterium]
MAHSQQNIFLIGPMGSGKTTIGRQLAKLLGLTFYDCDHELERLTGASVSLIFDIEGEAGFRQRESRLLDELSAKKGVLIATGGGVICNEENRRILRTRGFVVYLKTGIEQQLARLSKDKSRPLLQAADRKRRLKELARVRNPLYTETADLVFSTLKSSIYASAKALAMAISEQANPINPHIAPTSSGPQNK